MNRNKLFKKIIKIGITIFLIFIISSIILGGLLVYIPSRMTQKHTDDISQLFLNDMNYDIKSFSLKYDNKIEDLELISKHSHTIPVTYICKNNTYDNKTIVLVHWHETNHNTMFPLVEFFFGNGYNVVLYDQRAHGKNTAPTVTFGLYEKDDLEAVVSLIREKMTKDNTIGLLGQSMGASTVGNYIGSSHANKNIDFAIVESPFSSMYDEIQWNISKVVKVKFISNYLLWLGSTANNLFKGYYYDDVDIVKSIQTTSIPTLVIHSKSDKVCPYYMGKEIYDAIPHKDKLMLSLENEEHVQAFFKQADTYKEHIIKFISQYTKK